MDKKQLIQEFIEGNIHLKLDFENPEHFSIIREYFGEYIDKYTNETFNDILNGDVGIFRDYPYIRMERSGPKNNKGIRQKVIRFTDDDESVKISENWLDIIKTYIPLENLIKQILYDTR